MTKGKKIVTIAVCLAVVAGSASGGFMFYRSKEAQKHKVEVIPVSYVMEQYWGDEIRMDGMVAASNTQSVVLSNSQLVDKVLIKEGDIVKKGTPLLDYDMTAVELDVAQKKTALALAQDNIRQAKKELDKLKGLRPSEEAPDFSEDFFEPDFPDEPWDLPNILSEVKDVSDAAMGSGLAGDPYQFACKGETVVYSNVLEQLRQTNKSAVFVVYDETGYAAYAWLVSPDSLRETVLDNWVLGSNITLTDDGGVQIHGGGVWYGIVQVGGTFDYDPADNSEPDEPTEPATTTEEATTEPPTTEITTEVIVQPASFIRPLSVIVPLAANNNMSEDYMYSRSELQYKISQQEVEIRSLEIAEKKAQIEYDAAVEKQQNPQEIAKINGVVTKIAKSVEDLEVGEPFLVVRGEGGVTIQGTVSEVYLDKIKPGSVVNVNSWDTGEMVSARITEVDNTPSSYDYQSYGQNPNNSLYPFRASVEESCELTVGNYVSITFSGEAESGNFYIPLSYVRQENGQYYVMKESEDGKLEKQIIQTGKIIYGGYSIEVISGLNESDYICFPYGKYVTEGALVKKNSDTSY